MKKICALASQGTDDKFKPRRLIQAARLFKGKQSGDYFCAR
ncbi:hypothetical protein NSA36_07070 [Anaerotruncus colihominis]|nr:hypothetical protein [Anaerotruncus colihominis]